jgi:hypothetical protein
MAVAPESASAPPTPALVLAVRLDAIAKLNELLGGSE